MPQALTIATAIFVSLGASGTIAAIGAYLLAGALVVGFTAGLNAVLAAVFGPSRPKPSDGLIQTREAVGSRKRDIGIVHSSGQLTFEESRAGTLGLVLTLATGRNHDILEHRINDQVVTLDGSGTVTEASFKGAVHVHTRSGAADQTAIAELTAAFPEWTSDHRQLGCAHVALICDPVDAEDFSEVYNSRKPAYTQVRKGVGQYDPRLDDTAVIGTDANGDPVYGVGSCRIGDETTWPWSDNWALCIANYFAHADGFGGGYDRVNWANIAAEADIADQLVNTKSAETIGQWRLWARYSLAEEKRAEILAAMQTAADGFTWQDAEGKFNVLAGRWEEPDLVLTDDAILALSAAQGPEAEQRVGAMKVMYTEAAIGYREQESATIGSIEATDDGEVQALTAYYAPHHNQAMRVGKPIFARLGNDRWQIELQCNLLGLDLIGRRFCKLDSALFGVTGWFMIERPKIDFESMTVSAKLVQVEPGDWDFDPLVDEGTLPASSASSPGAIVIPVPGGVAAGAVAIALGETNGVAIAVSWADPGRAGLTWEVQYRPTAGGDWIPMQVNQQARTARSGPVDSGTEYEVRIRAVSLRGRVSAWSVPVTITPVAVNTLLPPSDLAAATGASAGEADLTWRNPFGASFDHVKIFESTADDFGSAGQIGGNFAGGLGAVMDETFTGLSAGTHYFWAVAYDAAANPTAAAGSVSATVT